MKTKTLIYFMFLSLWLMLGCKKDPEKEGPCGFIDPTTELPWLKKEIERYQNLPGYATGYSVAIGTIIYKGERVFWKYDMNASSTSPLFRCDGSLFYLPSQNLSEEEKQMLFLINNPSQICAYAVWQSPIFKQRNCN